MSYLLKIRSYSNTASYVSNYPRCKNMKVRLRSAGRDRYHKLSSVHDCVADWTCKSKRESCIEFSPRHRLNQHKLDFPLAKDIFFPSTKTLQACHIWLMRAAARHSFTRSAAYYMVASVCKHDWISQWNGNYPAYGMFLHGLLLVLAKRSSCWAACLAVYTYLVAVRAVKDFAANAHLFQAWLAADGGHS